MRGPDYALGKEEIDDKDKHYSCSDKDVGGNGYMDIFGVDSPYDAQSHGDNPGHAEAEQGAGDDELVSSCSVDLEDGHMGCGADHEKDEKDGTYWDIEADCRYAAEGCGGRGVRRMEVHFIHRGSLRKRVVSRVSFFCAFSAVDYVDSGYRQD